MKLVGNRPTSRRGGWTLLELSIAVSFLVLVMVNLTSIMQDTSETTAQDSSAMHLEDQARHVLDRIAFAIAGADRETLTPLLQSPLLHASGLQYRLALGVEDGEVVWTDPESILQDDGTRLLWQQNPGLAEERRVVWSHLVEPFLEGELVNGVDDNGNGLIDEQGLAFVINGNQVTIRLSLGRNSSDGTSTVRTVETRVTCRN